MQPSLDICLPCVICNLTVLILLYDENLCDYKSMIHFFFNHWLVSFVIDLVLQISMDFTDDSFTMDFRLLSEGLVIALLAA